jgi:hypothetical protein
MLSSLTEHGTKEGHPNISSDNRGAFCTVIHSIGLHTRIYWRRGRPAPKALSEFVRDGLRDQHSISIIEAESHKTGLGTTRMQVMLLDSKWSFVLNSDWSRVACVVLGVLKLSSGLNV